MKGLFIKDMLYLKNQGKVIGLFLLIGLLVMTAGAEAVFVNSYITFVFATLVLSTITYDEYENGSAYLFTMPISRTGYVNEKYLLGLILCGIGWLISVLLAGAVMFIKEGTGLTAEFWFVAMINLVLALAFMGISMPIRIKFGAEKGKIISFILIGIVMLLVYLKDLIGEMAEKVFHAFELTTGNYSERISAENLNGIKGIALIAVFLLFALSWMISMRILKKKEY